jgi:hypothetical protein
MQHGSFHLPIRDTIQVRPDVESGLPPLDDLKLPTIVAHPTSSIVFAEGQADGPAFLGVSS